MSRSGHATRQRSRQVALQALYANDLARREGREPVSIEESFERVAENFDLPEGARGFAAELAFGVVEHAEQIDALLAESAINWKLSRMAAVDRNVLRLAAYELLCAETPASVVIDQAIELARRFGGEPSPGFVNGVLDAVARELGRAETSEEVR